MLFFFIYFGEFLLNRIISFELLDFKCLVLYVRILFLYLDLYVQRDDAWIR